MNTLQKQFSDSLKREGKYITTYYTSESVKCLFRKNNDHNNVDNHITLFYEITAPIKQGQLLTYGGKQYLTLSQESIENDTYYKSALLECNLLLPVKTNSGVCRIPAYISELSSPGIIKGTVITTQDGTGEILTEVTESTMNILINNNTINIIGGYYDVVSQYYRNGISHIIIERGVKPVDSYTFDIITDNTNVEIGSSTTLSIIAQNNGDTVEGQTFTFTSSDELVATVDSTGLVSFLAEGTVTITGIWVNQKLSDTVVFTVVTEVIELPYTFDLVCASSTNTVYMGNPNGRNFTASMVDKDGLTVDFTPVWSFDWNGMDSSNFTITYPSTYKCNIVVKDDDLNIIGNTFTIICDTTVEDILYSKSIVVTIEV
ncbi:Ig-like domain-containing protein [Anaerosporobacter sp.]